MNMRIILLYAILTSYNLIILTSPESHQEPCLEDINNEEVEILRSAFQRGFMSLEVFQSELENLTKNSEPNSQQISDITEDIEKHNDMR